jgi:glutamine amidotransferase
VGDSDSEWAFCALLERLAPLWSKADGEVPPLTERLSLIAELAEELRALGTANFIYGDSTALFVHADRRTQMDGAIRAPGLYLLQRACWRPGPELAEAGISLATVRQDVSLVASIPLTDELWRPLGAGEVLALQGGRCLDVLGRESNDFASRLGRSQATPCGGSDIP